MLLSTRHFCYLLIWSLAQADLFTWLLPASCTRVRLNESEEPTNEQVYNNFRWLMKADKELFMLKSAGLLDDSSQGDEYLDDELQQDGSYKKANLTFVSTEAFRKGSVLNWFVPLKERVALHRYENQKERDAAAGPDVDQEMCGLLLEYMQMMVNQHLKNVATSSERSIFFIMNSFDTPRLGLAHGNTIFDGSYQTCIDTELNVMREELEKVDQQGADKFFKSRLAKSRRRESTLKKATRFLKVYFGPFLGILTKPEVKLMKKHADKIQPLSMRYCYSGLRWPQWSNRTYYKRNFVFRVATCLPFTCDSNSLELYKDKIEQLVRFQLTKYYDDFYIDELFCLPDEKSELRNPLNYGNSLALIIFLVVWSGLTIVATLLNNLEARKGKRKSQAKQKQPPQERKFKRALLDSWCLKENINRLCRRGPEPVASKADTKFRVNLNALEGLKVISSCAIITSHNYIVSLSDTWVADRAELVVSESWLAMFNLMFPAVVDFFFVITGIITAKTLFQMSRKTLHSFSFWIMFFLLRYVRIVPMYLLVHWFLQALFRFLGSGPYWDYGTSHTSWGSMCPKESLWNVVLLRASLFSPAKHCNVVGWYLANDLQAALLTPLVVLLYLKRPSWAKITVLCSTVAIMVNHVRYYLSLSIDSRGGLENTVMILSRITDEAADGYVQLRFRCVGYLIGLGAGHLLHEYDEGKIKEWPKWLVVLSKSYVYFFIYLLAAQPYITTLLPLNNQPLMHLLGSLAGGLLHGLSAIAAAMFVIMLCTGHMARLSSIFSHPMFKPFANASLCTLLVHVPLIFYHSLTITSSTEFTVYSFLANNLVRIFESVLLALVVHVLFELPFRRFFSILLMKFHSNDFLKNEQNNTAKERKNQ